jgi:antitoxin (DNA-binding transcriptional repressor) of toxin-antitoxin stability system
MKVSVKVAETKLSELIDAALAGEEVVIDREGKKAVKLVPLEPRNNFRFGVLKGQITEVPDFFEPMSEEDLALWEGGP